MKIQINQEDIDNGLKKSCTECPIARAFYRITNIKDFNVTCGTIIVFYPPYNRHLHIKIPPEAKEFIYNFDNNMPVKPFEFEISYEPIKRTNQ